MLTMLREMFRKVTPTPTFDCPKCFYRTWPGDLISANRHYCGPDQRAGFHGCDGEHLHGRCPRCFYQTTEPLPEKAK